MRAFLCLNHLFCVLGKTNISVENSTFIFFYNHYIFSIHIICYKVKETHEFLSKFIHSITQAKISQRHKKTNFIYFFSVKAQANVYAKCQWQRSLILYRSCRATHQMNLRLHKTCKVLLDKRNKVETPEWTLMIQGQSVCLVPIQWEIYIAAALYFSLSISHTRKPGFQTVPPYHFSSN